MNKNIKIFEKKPDDFNAKVDVAAAYIEIDGKVLLLQLSDRKEYSKRWGVPAGKFEQGETPENALRRELFEETGILLAASNSVRSIGQLYIRKPEMDYVSHIPQPLSRRVDFFKSTSKHAKHLMSNRVHV